MATDNAVAHGTEDPDDPGQHHEVEEPDEEQERRRHDGAEQPAELLEGELLLEMAENAVFSRGLCRGPVRQRQ